MTNFIVKNNKNYYYTNNNKAILEEKVKMAYLLFFKRHSNIFLVLLNEKKKHIITLTAGNCLLGKKKKEKMAIHNMYKMVKSLMYYLDKFNINFIYIYIRQRVGGHFFNLQKLLKKNNIRIIGFRYILKRPHSHIRKRKLRRV